jgi:hypothetical protein
LKLASDIHTGLLSELSDVNPIISYIHNNKDIGAAPVLTGLMNPCIRENYIADIIVASINSCQNRFRWSRGQWEE